jgi:tRNA(adenine34) deaminase
MLLSVIDTQWMQEAYKQAEKAAQLGEVAVGAVLVDASGSLIATGFNQTRHSFDPSAHAEIQVLRQAGSLLKNERLPNTTLYVTLEPCMMCLAAMIHARLFRVCFGAKDPKIHVTTHEAFWLLQQQANHRLRVSGGILADKCALLLQDFFIQKRKT